MEQPMAKKKTTTKKTTKANPEEAANEKPKRTRGVQTEVGDWARTEKDPELEEIGERWANLAEKYQRIGKEAGQAKNEMLGAMKAKRVDLYVLEGGWPRIRIKDKGVGIEMEREPKKKRNEDQY